MFYLAWLAAVVKHDLLLDQSLTLRIQVQRPLV